MSNGPSFIGIGAQRAGSTWLASALQRHPEIFVAPRKEIHYFDRHEDYPSPSMCAAGSLRARLFGRSLAAADWRFWLCHTAKQQSWGNTLLDSWWSRYFLGRYDDDWYRSLFRSNHPFSGEFTPAYALLKKSDIEWVRHTAPQAKIILVMRNPIERDWSQFRFHCRWHGVADDEKGSPIFTEC